MTYMLLLLVLEPCLDIDCRQTSKLKPYKEKLLKNQPKQLKYLIGKFSDCKKSRIRLNFIEVCKL